MLVPRIEVISSNELLKMTVEENDNRQVSCKC